MVDYSRDIQRLNDKIERHQKQNADTLRRILEVQQNHQRDVDKLNRQAEREISRLERERDNLEREVDNDVRELKRFQEKQAEETQKALNEAA